MKSRAAALSVPRTIHQIWIGPDPLPDEHRPWIKGWKRHHPNWNHRLWTEADLRGGLDLTRPEVRERLRAPVERADILRLEILYRHGGVYVDTDVECLRPIDDVLGDREFVIACLKPGQVTNTFVASVPGHPLLERALREVRPMEDYWTMSSPPDSIKRVAGPPFLGRLVPDYPEVELLEPPLLFPSTAEERGRAIAVHHMARTWHNIPTLRRAMLQAERRLESTRAELERERRRHAATAKRLAKLEEHLKAAPSGGGRTRRRLGILRRSG
jgi:mannosyltransferase OCH1-like enzyme